MTRSRSEAGRSLTEPRFALHTAIRDGPDVSRFIGMDAKPSMTRRQVWFHAWPCPDGLDYGLCTQAGDKNGVYHGCRWARNTVCPSCKSTGFDTLRAVKVRGEWNLEGIYCPVCITWIEVFEQIGSEWSETRIKPRR